MLHVINSLSGSGGAEQGLAREISRLDDEFEQEVVTLYDGGELKPVVESAGARVHSLGLDPQQSGWNWVVGAERLRRRLRLNSPQIVHSSLASANLVSQLATWRLDIPLLSTFTLSGDVSLMRSFQPGADTWKASLFRAASGYASRLDHVWFRAITRDAATTNARAMGIDETRIVVIPRGVSMSDDGQTGATEALRADLGLPTDRAILLNVGRQTAQKGQVYLIQAFQAVRQRRPAHLVILGREGDGTEALYEAINQASLGSDVTVIPYTDRVRDFCQAADVFVFPSLMEGLGTAVLEAMAEGLPVVGFDIPPVAEITDGGRVAILVDRGDTAQLSAAINQVLEDPAVRSRLSREAEEWTRAQFSIASVSARLGDVLRELAEGDGRLRP